MKKNTLLIGNGEIGSAIKQIEEEAGNNVYVQELNEDAPILAYDVCHINIPQKNKNEFIDIVMTYLVKYKPLLTIINSTVAVGTTEFISKQINDFGMQVVHSPCRGVHPNLYEGIKTFVKYVGGSEKAMNIAKEHFDSIGINCIKAPDCNHTEMAKKYSTTYYNWNINYCRLCKEDCDKNNLSFDFVYNEFNKSYNEGYTKLNMTNVVRPILYPPKDVIGGHCQLENIELLPDSELKTMCKLLNLQDKDKKQKILKIITKELAKDL